MIRLKTALVTCAAALALLASVAPASAQTRVQLRNSANTDFLGTAANPLPVTGNVVTVTAVPTVSSSPAYAANDAMGGLLTFSNAALTSGGGGFIQSVVLNFKSAQTAPTDLVWCGASNMPNTTVTDNAAVAVTGADFDKCRVIHVTDCSSLGTPSVCAADNLAFPFTLSSGTTGYGFLVTRGTPTLGSTSDVSVSLRILR